jgi:hypothetical protein
MKERFKMIKNLLFLILALALLALFYLIFNFLFKLLFKLDDQFINFRKENNDYFEKQKSKQYNEWKNPYNTSSNNKENVFPECLKILSFNDWPKDLNEIKNQYRTLAKKKHPDMGGSQEEFEKINKAYQEALSLERYKS